ncbi:MAG TPA: hypothetical protein VN962_05385 [Polyangia bacterium]|nr:hypothetical protein [Polyangia bacterium]
MAYPDVPAGASEWSRMTGVHSMSPMVGGPGLDGSGSGLPYNVDGARSRVTTNDAAVNYAPAMAAHTLDDWRDVFNFKGSPIPWLLLLTLVMVGFAHFRVQTRVGKASANVALG